VFLAKVLTAVVVLSAAAIAQVRPAGEFIFALGSTSFPSSHASTIVELKGGGLMAAWFGGTHERDAAGGFRIADHFYRIQRGSSCF
jgi:predicted neuraminidase